MVFRLQYLYIFNRKTCERQAAHFYVNETGIREEYS